MKYYTKVSLLEDQIKSLKKKLDSAVQENKMNSDKILKISRQLDALIVGYYNLKRGVNV